MFKLGRSPAFAGAIGYHVDRSGITEAGRVSHDPIDGLVPAVARSLVIGDRLFTLSRAGVSVDARRDVTLSRVRAGSGQRDLLEAHRGIRQIRCCAGAQPFSSARVRRRARPRGSA